MSVLKTHRPDPSPGRQGGSETHNSATAAVNPPTTVGVATLSPPKELPPLNQSLIFSNVTMPELQAAGIPVPSMDTAPQFSANPPASRTAAGASREGASAGPIHLEGDYPSRGTPGATPTVGEVLTTMGVDDDKSPNPVGRTANPTAARGALGSRLPEIGARPRHLPPTRDQIPSQSHLRLRRRRSAPNRNVFLSGSRRTTAYEACATTEPTGSSMPTRP